MREPLIYFAGQPTDRGPARIRSKRNMICLPLGQDPRPVTVGEELEISDRTLRELTDLDVEFLGRVPEPPDDLGADFQI